MERTFSSLGLALDNDAVTFALGTGPRNWPWTKKRLIREFGNLKSSGKEVHAEVQVVLAAARHRGSNDNVVPYVGCSKFSCFLCFNFLRAYGSFESKGCHGKVYDLWNVLGASGMAEKETTALFSALRTLTNIAKSSILGQPVKSLNVTKESTARASSGSFNLPHFEDDYAQLLMWHLTDHRQKSRSDPDKPTSPACDE